MRAILLGAPGAGKGTQADELSERMGGPHISTGDLFRQAVKDQTAMGLNVRRYMENGTLVPDEVTISVVRDRLALEDCAAGFFLDGFPRTEEQARALDKFLEERGEKLDAVIYVDVDTEALISRISGRRTCKKCGALYHISYSPSEREGVCDKCGGDLYQRDDDQEETVRRRLEVYNGQTLPLAAYYRKQGILLDIDGNNDKNQVTQAILARLR